MFAAFYFRPVTKYITLVIGFIWTIVVDTRHVDGDGPIGGTNSALIMVEKIRSTAHKDIKMHI